MIVDKYLEDILEKMTEEYILFISADHRNDPTRIAEYFKVDKPENGESFYNVLVME